MKRSQIKVLNRKFHKKMTSGETRNKTGGRRPEGHIKDPRNKRMENTSLRQRRMEGFSEGRQAPEGAVAP
jgi:hypothetical protein